MGVWFSSAKVDVLSESLYSTCRKSFYVLKQNSKSYPAPRSRYSNLICQGHEDIGTSRCTSATSLMSIKKVQRDSLPVGHTSCLIYHLSASTCEISTTAEWPLRQLSGTTTPTMTLGKRCSPLARSKTLT